jgi:Icc-related predicted phosphoesterase
MRICHYSDNHSLFLPLYGRYDAIISTGDFMPNSHHVFNGDRDKEARFQRQWLKDNIELLRQQLRGCDFLFVLGNHDFVDPEWMEQFLRSEGIMAYNLTNKLVPYAGINFYGFPFVPTIDGHWNYERAIPEMQQEVRRLVDVVNNNRVDVLACHCPPYDCLDIDKETHWGNRIMNDALDYQIDKDKLPKYYFTGHCHQNYGIRMREGMLVVNSATVQHVIEFPQ